MSLKSLSPLDGRYSEEVRGLRKYFSEWALMKYRIHVEVEWLITMSENGGVFNAMRPLTQSEHDLLRSWVADFDDDSGRNVKDIERTTNHDVKAIEYYLSQRSEGTSLADIRQFIHFCCTSEDINNLAYGLLLKEGILREWLPRAQRLVDMVTVRAIEHADIAMLARTHGQPATTTTLGKELAVFVWRWQRQLAQLRAAEFLGKFNGAVGNYAAHLIAYPEADWEDISRKFVERLGLTFNPLTTQIEPHDYMAEIFQNLTRFNNITRDFNRDMWLYISLKYFLQEASEWEVGSSTMPHKVNPIHFENSEANCGLSISLLNHLADNLTVSRLQRDLTDSTILRNIGVAIGHSVVSLESSARGLSLLKVNPDRIQDDLENGWEVIAEAVQTIMRKAGCHGAYEIVKELTRGKTVTAEDFKDFIQTMELSDIDKGTLLALSPWSYTGLAGALVRHIAN